MPLLCDYPEDLIAMSDPIKFASVSADTALTQLLNQDEILIYKFDTTEQKFKIRRITKENFLLDAANNAAGVTRQIARLDNLPAGAARGTITMGRCVSLLTIKSTEPARIRLYCTQVAGDQDLARNAGVFPANSSGLMIEFIATSSILKGLMSPAQVIYNDDAPTNSWLYYTVESAAGTNVEFTYLEYEK